MVCEKLLFSSKNMDVKEIFEAKPAGAGMPGSPTLFSILA